MQIFIYCKVTLHVSGVTAPIIRSTKTVTAASGTGHNTGTATSLQRSETRKELREEAELQTTRTKRLVYFIFLPNIRSSEILRSVDW